MEALFLGLTRAVEGAGGAALAAPPMWGILSIVLSPATWRACR